MDTNSFSSDDSDVLLKNTFKNVNILFITNRGVFSW